MQKPLLRAAQIVVLLSLIISPFGAFVLAVTSADAQTPPPASPLAITEILPNALDENTGEILEIRNVSSGVIDLAAWSFADTTTTVQPFIPFPAQLPIGLSQTQLGPGQIALVLDKDYADEYNAEILARVPAVHVILVTTSKGNLSLANSTDRIALVDAAGFISDEVVWTADPGSEIPLSRTLRLDGSLSAVAADAEGRSLGFLQEEVPVPILAPNVRLSEALPNPVDSDAAEFVEVENVGDSVALLDGLTLKDASGKEFALSGELQERAYKSVPQSESGITLNNDSEKIQLWFAGEDGPELLDETSYENAHEGQSWSRFEQEFRWTTSVTSGLANVLTEPEQLEEIEEADEQLDQENDSPEEEVRVASIAEAKSSDDGELLQIEGVVATRLGNFFANSLHIIDASGGILVRVPEVFSADIGQKLRIRGERSDYRQMPRIEVGSAEAIEKLGTEVVPVVKKDISALTKDDVGSLLQVSGKVVRRSGASFRVGSDENDVLVSVRSGSGITKKAPAKAVAVTVSGIVLASDKQIVLAPRSEADLTSASATLLKSGPMHSVVLSGTAGFLAAIMVILWERRRAGWSDQSRSSAYRDAQ
jgi:hypothetical protein